MKPLSPFESLREGPLPKETVEEAFRNAVRCRELRDNPLFQWWRKRVIAGTEKLVDRLKKSEGDLPQIRYRQGVIFGMESIFTGLDKLAEGVEPLNERLKEYND